ncbi:DUF732 domain-containing protein [Rhodococcus hoagii]|nr:DUF732 domain-containing protein [Prescottella equi]MBM4558188.1 DUF732 domain-containing protein [Prescottella equi]
MGKHRTLGAIGAATLSVVLLVGCSGDGEEETPLTGDAAFLSSLKDSGLTGSYADADAIQLAQGLCKAQGDRANTDFLVSIMETNENFAYPGKEREFADASVSAYCPPGKAVSAAATSSAAATTTLRRGEISPEDRAFLASLDSFWTDGVDRADLIEVGTSLCEKMRGGASKMDVLRAVLPETGPADDNINLLHAATVAYCPEQLTGIK